MAGEALPTIHTVGFFAEEHRSGPGERFLRQLSALTGGSFQVCPLNGHIVNDNDGSACQPKLDACEVRQNLAS